MTATAETRVIARPGSPSAHAARRRTFAIISHPDAGKTTLTEKLLLYAGAVAEAGQVRARRNRREVVSDWMEMERDRGISITSTALRFDFLDTRFNLIDTPGHRDFSEDTFRVLAAADSAVMLVDAAKGIEEQTLKLFHVARERRIPLITFVNKLDRPALEPLALIDQIERELRLRATPVTWPVGSAERFRGVIDRRDGSLHRFKRTPGGATEAIETRIEPGTQCNGDDDWATAEEEVALLDGVGASLSVPDYLAAEATPVFFGSALSNFGVRLLLHALVELAPPPQPRPQAKGEAIPLDAPFSGQVFKLQANLDPRHRDRLAFVRVCSGRFERGMKATDARTGERLSLNYAHELFGQERTTVDEAYPGDVVGLVSGADVRVGDTLFESSPVEFPPFRILAPERFAAARNRDTSRYKQFRRGLAQLEEEGVVHVLHRPEVGAQAPILAGIGSMQFEVAAYRMANEFGAEIELEPLGWSLSRLIGAGDAAAVQRFVWGEVLEDSLGRKLAVFRKEFELERFARDHPEIALDRFIAGA
jgi:peptide chain release factor 3